MTMPSATLRTLATILGAIAIAYFVGSIVLGTLQGIGRELDDYNPVPMGTQALSVQGTNGLGQYLPDFDPLMQSRVGIVGIPCHEDEAFLPTHYSDSEGLKDTFGVHRKCQAIDDYYASYWRA